MEELVKTSVSAGNICAYLVIDGKICTADCNPALELEGPNVWYVSRVFVPEKLRGIGIGKMLLNKMFEELLKSGAKQLVVYPGGYGVDEQRQMNFYKENGFEETATKCKLIKTL